jgi:hypothetical protein
MQKPKKPFPWRFAGVVLVVAALIVHGLLIQPDPTFWAWAHVRAVRADFKPAAADLYAARALCQIRNRYSQVESPADFLEQFPHALKRGATMSVHKHYQLPLPPRKGTPDRPVLPS